MIAESSPFPHHGPLQPDQVHGRDDLIALLLAKVTARQVTALLGPRRYGKTSVLRKVAADLEAAGTSVVWVDLFEVTSLVDVAIRLDDALNTTTNRVGAAIRRIASSLDLSVGGVKVTFSRPSRPEPIATLHVLLDLLVDAAATTPTVIILDEFSSIASVPGVAGLLRTKLQHHFQTIGVMFAGSEPSTMRALFSEREQPFYGQADLVTIEPLTRRAVNDLISDGFTSTGRDPGPLGDRIGDLCAGHPRRTMQAADLAWQISTPGQKWSPQVWTDTVAELEARTDDGSETLYASLDDTDKKVLRIIASGGSIDGRAAELLGLNPSPARLSLARLVDAGHLTTDRTVVDPMLAHWLRRRLPI